MDLNLNLGLPLCPPPLSVDMGYDLALNALPLDIADDEVFMRLPSIDSVLSLDDIPDPENLFEPFDLPSYTDIPPIPIPAEDRRRNDTFDSLPYSESLIFDNEPLARTGGHRHRRELLECPEVRFQRLIESRDRWEMARTRSGRDDSSPHSATDPERLMRDIRRSGRLVGPIGKHKADKAPLVEGSAEEKNERSGGVTDFDCNVCLELAKEPVVTSCGHLFCWPCLYQWLYVHCDHKECPVCKGKVNESNVVPIYGRGSSEASGRKKKKKKDGEDGHQGLNIPPRPQGNRIESLRQQFRSPLFRTSEIIHGMNELISQLPEGFQLFRRVERDPQPARTVPSMSIPPVAAGSPPRDGRASQQQQQQSRLQRSNAVAIIAGFRRRETVTVSDDLHDPAPSPSQASTSSTMAMIQGDSASVPSDAPVEPGGAGTSMVLRRRTRGRTTTTMTASNASSDVNGRSRQRRRMN